MLHFSLGRSVQAREKQLSSVGGVNIHVFLLNVPRSLNELRVLLLESHRHSRDMEKDLNRDVHKAEWKVKEQKLQDDIKSLREKLLLLVRTRLAVYTSSNTHKPKRAHTISVSLTVLLPRAFEGRERSSPDHRRYSMLDPSALDSEMNRLRQRLLSTEDALRNALEHNQQVDQLVQAMRQRPDRSPVTSRAARSVH